jgi:hypothetical protein
MYAIVAPKRADADQGTKMDSLQNWVMPRTARLWGILSQTT